MNTYFVEFDGNDYSTQEFYTPDNYKQLIEWVTMDLEECGGGHADIYNEDGIFVEDVEV